MDHPTPNFAAATARAQSTWSSGDFNVIDLGSNYGTYVKGKRVQEARIKVGELFVLGNKQFVRTTLNCSAGGVIRTELTNENNKPGNTHGVGEDDHGNVFKISVYN